MLGTFRPHTLTLSSPPWHWFPHQRQCLSVHCQSVDHRRNRIRGEAGIENKPVWSDRMHGRDHSPSFSGIYGIRPSHRRYGYEQSKEEAELGVFSRAPPRSRPEARTHTAAALTCLLLQFRTSSCLPRNPLFLLMPLKALLKIPDANQMEVHVCIFYYKNAT